MIWLARRLSRISPAEVPYRMRAVLRSLLQSRGVSDASTVPPCASTGSYGRPWVATREIAGGIDRESITTRADELVGDKLVVFDSVVPFVNGAPEWNCDPVSGIAIPLRFGLFIDFRHIPGIDIKHLWEVNRMCWLVPVAQAYAITREAHYLTALTRWLTSWLDACPYPLGPNWSSPVEHGIRLINWSIVWHLIGGHQSPAFADENGGRLKRRWLDAVYRHVRFASDNYSFYSSADNHLIGEAAGVFVAAQTWDLWQDVRKLRDNAQAILEREVLLQFAPDGVNREQAFCYHRFSLEFLLASGLSARANGHDFSDAFWHRIEAAIVFLASMMDCTGEVPPIGDADDATVFVLGHGASADPYQALLTIGARMFDQAALARKINSLPTPAQQDVALWLFGEVPNRAAPTGAADLPRRFEHGGYLITGDRLDEPEELRLVFDVGPLGYNRIGGHAHADALSVLLSWGGVPFLVDAGTFCYNAAPEFRRFFRGTSAHNTLEVDGVEQSLYGGSFLWLRDLTSTLEVDIDDGRHVVMQARHDGYKRLPSPAEHQRRIEYDRTARRFVITDTLLAAERHAIAAHWHFDAACNMEAQGTQFVADSKGRRITLTIEGCEVKCALVRGQVTPPQGWVSKRFYVKEPAWVLRAHAQMTAGDALVTVIQLDV